MDPPPTPSRVSRPNKYRSGVGVDTSQALIDSPLRAEHIGAIRMSKVDVFVNDGTCYEDYYKSGVGLVDENLFNYYETPNNTASLTGVKMCDGIPDGRLVLDFNIVLNSWLRICFKEAGKLLDLKTAAI